MRRSLQTCVSLRESPSSPLAASGSGTLGTRDDVHDLLESDTELKALIVMMTPLELYLDDCESKRRRTRDRPSDAVLAELRLLLKQLKDARPPGGQTSLDSTHGGATSDQGVS